MSGVRVLYFDCIAGISGDMALGALVDAGADWETVTTGLATLALEPFEVDRAEVQTHGIVATRVAVRTSTTGIIRTYGSIRAMLEQSGLPADALAIAQRIFLRLAEAEAKVHRKEVEQVTFHEVGAVDSIVDIAGTALALAALGVERVYSSPVPTGFGMVKTEHGMMPVPVPAVVELLRGAPIYSRGVQAELVTPTGAAILAALSEGYGDMPAMHLESSGYGVGTHEFDDLPNVLRVMIGTAESERSVGEARGSAESTEMVLATNIDDLNPELYAFVIERLLEAGAQDAWVTPIVMKKGRPAVTLSALCSPQQTEAIRRVIFRETGTLGVRTSAVAKHTLDRDIIRVDTRYGKVAVKVGILEDGSRTFAPEFEDCTRAARAHDVAAREVYHEALRAARAELQPDDDDPLEDPVNDSDGS